MLPETLTPERVARVFKGLLQGEEAELALAFGPALALTRPEATGFDPEGSQVVEIVADLLGAADGHLPVVEVVSELGSRHGIPRALAALYLMAFVRHARAELELGATHSVRSIRGGRFPADRITWDLVPEVAFSETLVDHSRVAAPRLEAYLEHGTALRDAVASRSTRDRRYSARSGPGGSAARTPRQAG